jgi:hypothetical protein
VDHLEKLLSGLAAQARHANYFREYYRHGGGSPYMPAGARAEYRLLLDEARSNWCGLVIDVVAERLIVDGFRAAGTTEARPELWQWWQANKLDGRQMPLYVEALRAGIAFVSVWPGATSDAPPIIRAEDPRAVAVFLDADDPTVTAEAVKVGADYVWHYTAETVTTLRKKRTNGYEVIDELVNPLGAVPLVAFRTRPELDGTPTSDLADAVRVQDRITSTTFDRLMAQKFSAFRQRWVTGMAIPTDDDGLAVEPFSAAVDRLWMSEDPETKFGEFGEATLGGYINAVAEDIRHLASITRTPPHYLLGQMVNLSAEALKAAETGLTSKVHERQMNYGEAWEEVISLAAVAAGRPDLVDDSLETIWRRTETVSEAQAVDAAVKLDGLGVPRAALWERIGASPQQIEAWQKMATREAFTRAIGQPVEIPRQPATAALAGVAPPEDAQTVKAKADAMGVLIRAGVASESAASQVGLEGVDFTGAVPTSLRQPVTDAAKLEG